MIEKGIDKNINGQSEPAALLTKEIYRQSYADSLKVKKEAREARLQHKTPIPRHRSPLDDADELVAICVKDMKHKKTRILRRSLRNILGDGHHCLHVRYMQADGVDLLVSRHQKQALIKGLTRIGHSIVNYFPIAGIGVRLYESSEEQRLWRNAYCAHRTLSRTLRPGDWPKA